MRTLFVLGASPWRVMVSVTDPALLELDLADLTYG